MSDSADQSEAAARHLLSTYLRLVEHRLADCTEAVVLCGSLAMGSYVPGESDVDQVTILSDSASPEAEEQARQAARDAMDACRGAVNLADVVYGRGELDRPWCEEWDLQPGTKHRATVPEELLRMHDHGQVEFGEGFDVAALPRPTSREMIAYRKRWRRWNQQHQARHPEFERTLKEELSARIAAQVILSNAVWHYYFATERTCFNKHEIAERLQQEVPDYAFQAGVELATRVRLRAGRGIPESEFQELRGWFDALRQWGTTHAVDTVPRGKNANPTRRLPHSDAGGSIC